MLAMKTEKMSDIRKSNTDFGMRRSPKTTGNVDIIFSVYIDNLFYFISIVDVIFKLIHVFLFHVAHLCSASFALFIYLFSFDEQMERSSIEGKEVL